MSIVERFLALFRSNTESYVVQTCVDTRHTQNSCEDFQAQLDRRVHEMCESER